MKAFIALLTLFFIACTNPSSNGPGPGDFAREYLSESTYTSLLIEIQPVTGYSPTAGAQTALQNFLQGLLNKSGGITIQVNTAIASPGKTSYSLSDIKSLESAHRTVFNTGSQASAFILFVDGTYSGNTSSQVLGQAHGPTSIVIYQKSIQSLSGGIGQPTRQVLETTVLEHEFGHLLGLVSIGSPTQSAHLDVHHGAHCTNTNCLMYWSVDTSNFVGNLLGGTVPSLDAACLADLHANGGQ